MLEIDRVAAMEHDVIEGAADLLFIDIHGQPSVAVFFHIGNVAIDFSTNMAPCSSSEIRTASNSTSQRETPSDSSDVT